MRDYREDKVKKVSLLDDSLRPKQLKGKLLRVLGAGNFTEAYQTDDNPKLVYLRTVDPLKIKLANSNVKSPYLPKLKVLRKKDKAGYTWMTSPYYNTPKKAHIDLGDELTELLDYAGNDSELFLDYVKEFHPKYFQALSELYEAVRDDRCKEPVFEFQSFNLGASGNRIIFMDVLFPECD